ncbi:hypothetical protein VKT23_010952 [Stygiomarasmius scandens]|uniref:Uncharacterized protein n=1 Tax=Marasmiellus scandens TaxID=2682957 RepID=A0ABR1J9G0_9AGAR
MYSQRSPPQMIPSDRVRQLWTEFELWHAAQRLLINQRVSDALRELDLKWRVSSPKNRISQKDLEERKTMTRLEIEKTFSGNMVRLEWQRRLDRAGLQSDAWNDMTETEQRKVEAILGADMDPSELVIPTLQNLYSPRRGTLFSPVTSNQLRADSVLDSYAVVDPHSFSMEGIEDNESEPWEVVKSRRSDDESSVDVSTTSSVVFDSAGSSSVSRSSTQTSQTSSPEHIPSKSLASDVMQQSLLSGAKFVSPHISTNHPNSGRASDDICLDDSSSSLSASSSFEPVSAMNEAAHGSSSKPRSRYIGPELLTDLSEPVDEEAEFEKFKTDIRIRKIREFHQEAADADIQLTIDIAEARKSKSFTREHEAKRIEEHERSMLKLRKRKEEERQKTVEGERQRRRTEMQQRVQPAPTQSSEVRPEPHPLVTRLAGQKDTTTSTASETPTVRQSRSQRNALQMDWSSGGDTPTPTSRPSTWANQNVQTQPTTPADVIVEAPPLRRLPSAPSTSQMQPLASSSARMSTNSSSNIVPAQSTAAPAADQVVSPTNVLNQTGKAEPSQLKDKPKVISEPKVVASSSKTTLENMPKTSVSATVPSVPSNLTKAKPESATTSLPAPTMVSASTSSASAVVSPKSKAEPLSASSSKPVTSSNPVRPKVEPKASSSSVPSVVSTASVSAKARVAEPVSSLATSIASTISKPRVAEASTASAVANSVKPRVTEPVTAAPTTVSSAWPASTSSKAAPSSSATAGPPSAWTSWAPPTTLPQSSQVPEDRRVWVPPAQTTTEKSKRPPPTRKMTEPAPQAIEKTISNPQAKAQPIPIEVKRARRNSEPSSPSPKGFEFPHNAIAGSSKPADKRPEQPDASSRVSKKQSSGSKSTKGSKSSAKKVTIEEIDDEEGAEVEHLPTNSRYIMEPVQPKPVVPPAMFTQIFEYDGEQEKVERAKGVKANQATVQPENTGVEARSRQNNTGTETKDDKARASVQDAGSSKPIRPKQVRWSSEAMQRAEPQKDSFLSILDSLEEAMMHSNDQPRGDEIRQQTEQLNRMLSERRR